MDKRERKCIIISNCMPSSDWYQNTHTINMCIWLNLSVPLEKQQHCAPELRKSPGHGHVYFTSGYEQLGGDSHKVSWLPIFSIDRNYCALWIILLKLKSSSCLRRGRGVILLVLEIG